MGFSQDAERISQISTAWTVLFQAHEGPADAVKEARRQVLHRYSGPVYRYLRAAVGEQDSAEELYQDFALRFVRGDFRRAHPDRGRFRDFLKTSLRHLVIDHQRRKSRQPQPLPIHEEVLAAAAPEQRLSDQEFQTAWQAELLQRAWDALAQFEREFGQPLFTVLRLRADHPDWPVQRLAEQLSAGKPESVNANWIYKRLHFARQKFAALLVEEVRQTLDPPTTSGLEEELLELGLLDYCRPALAPPES